MYTVDTIVAIATPPGSGGVGIIRVSGAVALKAASKLLITQSEALMPGKMYFRSFIDAQGVIIDRGYFVWFRGPASFTGEDVVELHCHGGMMILTTIIRELLLHGVRSARPGEFSQRAFLNGKLDLVQTEAIMDMIDAQSRQALNLATNQYAGKLSESITGLRAQVTDVLGRMEVSMDYPDIDLDEKDWQQGSEILSQVRADLTKLIASFDEGKLYREGIVTVILGRPNVGKSSLLNQLAGEDRMIVTDVPGTTRDIVEVPVNIKGIPLRLVDTAGIRETEDLVEKIGVSRAKAQAAKADLVLLVLDRSRSFGADEEKLLEVAGANALVVLNKADLPRRFSAQLPGLKIIEISALSGDGLEELKQQIYHNFVRSRSDQTQPMVTNQRHYQGLVRAAKALDKCLAGWQANSIDLLAFELRECWEALGEITGNVWNEDLLTNIFGRFCLGK